MHIDDLISNSRTENQMMSLYANMENLVNMDSRTCIEHQNIKYGTPNGLYIYFILSDM